MLSKMRIGLSSATAKLDWDFYLQIVVIDDVRWFAGFEYFNWSHCEIVFTKIRTMSKMEPLT